MRCDRLHRGVDIGNVGAFSFRKWRGYGDDKNIRGLGGQGSTQLAAGYGGLDDHLQIRFDNMDFSVVYRLDDVRRDVDAEDIEPAACENAGHGQPNIPQPENRNALGLRL